MATEGAVDPTVIKKTQETLGKLIKKPALTEKLLKKPPFRFLHDIIKAVIKETGYFEGLYTKSELDSENIKDRDSKMKFLQKLIDVLKIATKENVTVKPSKIVAGHEPEKTNQLLQLVAFVIQNKVDCKEAIVSVNGGLQKQKENIEKSTNKSSEKPTKVKKSSDKNVKVLDKNERKEKIPLKVSEKTKDKAKKVSKDGDREKTKKGVQKLVTKDPKKSIETSNIPEAFEKAPFKEESILKKDIEEQPTPLQSENVTRNDITEKEEEVNQQSLEPERRNSLQPLASENNQQQVDTSENEKRSAGKRRKSLSSAKSSTENVDQKKDEQVSIPNSKNDSSNNNYSDELKPITANTTAPVSENKTISDVKRESTFVRQNSNEAQSRPRTSLRPPSVRPASARPGAPRRRDKNVEIILHPNDSVKMAGISVKVENFNSELEDDGENLVIIENSTIRDDDVISKPQDGLQLEQQGHLVQQILETQKELVQTDEKEIETEIDTTILQKRQSSAKQMDSLRDIIQNITRSVNPLGKLMDFIPEDMDSMQLEFSMWRDSYLQASSELRKERSYTESAIEPMKSQLAQINATIKEYTELIDVSRAKILQNTEKISKLLTE